MNTFKFFSLLFVISLAGCARQNNNTVIIHSVPADSIFTEISFSVPTTGQGITFEGGTTFRYEIDTVEVRSLYGRSSDGYFREQVFITPGDSVSFKAIANDENSYDVIFEGKNAAHYNYNSQKSKAVPWAEAPGYNFFSNSGIDLLEYKQQLQTFCNREIEFLRKYEKENTVSNDFMNFALAEINNRYAFKLYQIAYLSKCLQIPDDYLDDAVITQNLLSDFALDALEFKYVYCPSDATIERIYKAILDEVRLEFQPRLLSTLITWFAGRGDKVYEESLLQVMDKIEKTSTDSILLERVQEYKTLYLLSGTALPDSILDRTYLRSFQSEQKITLRKFFDNYKNRAIYLDFWYVGCPPCRALNKTSVENKPYLTEKNIATVYFSIDVDESAWLQAAKDDGVTENQYLLDVEWIGRSCNSPITNYLKVNSCPRYVLFNKNHEIEILKAPRSFGCEFEELKGMIEQMLLLQQSRPQPAIQKPAQKETAREQTPQEAVKTIPADVPQKSVLINGVHWATCNVAAPGAFAENPENAGMFYQWNRKVALPVRGKATNWDKNPSSGTTWKKENDPSPEGWRVPTFDEIKTLLDEDKVNNEWTTVNGINGRRFTDKANKNSIFLPAAGGRFDYGGNLANTGTGGFYWASTIDEKSKYYSLFFDNKVAGPGLSATKTQGFNIRSVA
jgi:uncharacterized protein (TIGR02145 family)